MQSRQIIRTQIRDIEKKDKQVVRSLQVRFLIVERDAVVTCFIPVKAHSERISRKNVRLLGGRRLFEYALSTIFESNVFDHIIVDTDDKEVAEWASDRGAQVVPRRAELASSSANGNDLLRHHASLDANADLLFQVFVTSPFLTTETIRSAMAKIRSGEADSVFTATQEYSWHWIETGVGLHPVNFRPDALPRSQDALPVLKETTSLYAITRDAFEKTQCRVGLNPRPILVSRRESIDIDVEEDWAVAEMYL